MFLLPPLCQFILAIVLKVRLYIFATSQNTFLRVHRPQKRDVPVPKTAKEFSRPVQNIFPTKCGDGIVTVDRNGMRQMRKRNPRNAGDINKIIASRQRFIIEI